MTKKQKKSLYRIIASAVLLIVAVISPAQGTMRFVCFLVPYAVIGWEVLWRAIRNIRNGQVFDENFLMALATVGAFACGEYPEGVAVMLFYQVGELFESVAVGRSRRSIAQLMDIRPDYANVERDGQVVSVAPDDVAVGDTIVVKAGERIPLDGVVLEGRSAVDTAALTGESVPRDVEQGDMVISGCVNVSGLLRVRTTKAYGESTVAKILDMVENAGEKKAKAENFITRFARYYTPVVVLCALLLAVIPSLITGDWREWVNRALIFLVVSCPCALVISIPLSFFGGIGGASKRGILIKGGNYLEALAQTGIVVFDKTGTLTKGTFSVTEVHPSGHTAEELLELAALAESWSDHPISKSLKTACAAELDPARATQAEEIPGYGVRTVVDGKTVCAGNVRLMEQVGADWRTECHHVGTIVHVAVDGVYAGHIVISDEVKAGSADAVAALKAIGVSRTVMLTGDTKLAGESVAEQLGLDEALTELLPADKVEQVERLLDEKKPGQRLVYVGDGINDAPVLTRADVGVAMGALGSDAAIEAADVVLMDDDPAKLPEAIQLARKTLRIVRQNIVFALGVKALVLLLGALGMANMWEAVFADVGVSVIAILNAGRMLRVGKK